MQRAHARFINSAGQYRGGAAFIIRSYRLLHCMTRTMYWTSKEVLASLGVLSLAVALYANSLTGNFVFDDHAAIEINPDVRWGPDLAELVMRKQKNKILSTCGRCN